MKIAGRKNDGAWYRTNKFLKKLDEAGSAQLAILIAAIPEITAAFGAVVDLNSKIGGDTTNWFTTVEAWADALSTNVPRQVFIGNLSFDTYSSITVGAVTRYTADHATEIRKFSIPLRHVYKEFMFGHRAVADLQNLKTAQNGNPGGIADATAGN